MTTGIRGVTTVSAPPPPPPLRHDDAPAHVDEDDPSDDDDDDDGAPFGESQLGPLVDSRILPAIKHLTLPSDVLMVECVPRAAPPRFLWRPPSSAGGHEESLALSAGDHIDPMSSLDAGTDMVIGASVVTRQLSCGSHRYVWLGGSGADLRSKARTFRGPASAVEHVTDLPLWNFDGSSTGQAPGDDSEVFLRAVALYRDPFRGPPHLLALCETLTPPSLSEHRDPVIPPPSAGRRPPLEAPSQAAECLFSCADVPLSPAPAPALRPRRPCPAPPARRAWQ